MLSSLATSFVILFALVYQNWKRSQTPEVQELIPNCLLTSHPIVFVPGKRSPFYFMGYWNQIPHWLASHGYEIFHLRLPWKNHKKRSDALMRFFSQKSLEQQKIHLFIDQSSLQEVALLLDAADFSCLLSVTLIGPATRFSSNQFRRLSIPIEEIQLPETHSRSPLFWMLHQLWTAQKASLAQLGWRLDRNQGQILLERAQFLAERDLLQRQRSPNLKA